MLLGGRAALERAEVAALMKYRALSVTEAARTVIFERLKPDDGGMIALSHTGEIAMPFNTNGMFRAAADSGGRFEVLIWEK